MLLIAAIELGDICLLALVIDNIEHGAEHQIYNLVVPTIN
jgi:hypothetical protein